MVNIIKSYKNYLKDNPNNLWFKRKLYGWGWTPAKWQGWLIIALYILIIIFSVYREDFITIIIATILLIYICYKKGEKPRWQWGIKK